MLFWLYHSFTPSYKSGPYYRW